MKQYAFVVELDRCIGCKGCQVACKMKMEQHWALTGPRYVQWDPSGHIRICRCTFCLPCASSVKIRCVCVSVLPELFTKARKTV